MFEAPTKRGCRRVSLDVVLTVVAVVSLVVFAVALIRFVDVLTVGK